MEYRQAVVWAPDPVARGGGKKKKEKEKKNTLLNFFKSADLWPTLMGFSIYI
jgi:hypothetical protein